MASPHVFFDLALIVLAIVSSFANASDPSPLQDFCVALPHSYLNINGFPCKNSESVTINDFYYSGLNLPRNTSNALGSNVTTVTATNLPGLNTLGISLARLDFAPYGGLNPPHTHPRATEVLLVLDGTLSVGFVTSNPQNKLFTKVLYPGDVFVFPIGLIHFQINLGNTPALAISALSSQNPGTITIANAVFGSNPPISTTVLAKAFQISAATVSKIQYYF